MLYNKTSERKIMEKTRVAKSLFSQFKGLMFERKKSFDYALVFVLPRESRIAASIHTFFVFFPIDVVFLDGKKKVAEIVHALQPFTPLYAPKEKTAYFIELPEGKSAGIKKGDILEWQL